MDLEKSILSDITVHMKYAKYIDDKQRRENWDELVTRNMNMHIKKFPTLEDEIREKEKLQEFDDEFIQLARKVYITNDRRFNLKNKINEMTNSEFKEQKSHDDCD